MLPRQVHTFLVYRIKELIELYYGSDDIKISETRGADITFETTMGEYAFEIETGNLLRKKKQLREKLKYLNKKYKDKWYFVVSNRNLAKHYREYGKVILRKG